MSDVDKHQRQCASNPNIAYTLNIDDHFDEYKFLNTVAGGEDIMLDKSYSVPNPRNVEDSFQQLSVEERKDPPSILNPKRAYSNKIDLNSSNTEVAFKMDSQKDTWEYPNTKNSQECGSKSQMEEDWNSIAENCMILPHLHKHDLFKKTTYDKLSSWIWGGYFTSLGCIDSFKCMFKNIDFEFPHFECGQCEFQIWWEWARYYAGNLDKVKFLHRSYSPVIHSHSVNLVLRSESESWMWSGMGLPNKCLTSPSGTPLVEYKQWICKTCDVRLWYQWIKRKDIVSIIQNPCVHEHFLFKGKYTDFFGHNAIVNWDAGEKTVGVSHQIDQEQMVFRCAPWNFDCCEDWLKYIVETNTNNEKEEIENGMLNESISNVTNNQVVYINGHKHPLIKTVDHSALCDNVISENWLSLKNKSNNSEPIYFKCLKEKCNVQMCALWVSPIVKKVKNVNGQKTCIIF